jgi:ribosomal protein L12E/L44/L45/RPP1/RPP2
MRREHMAATGKGHVANGPKSKKGKRKGKERKEEEEEEEEKRRPSFSTFVFYVEYNCDSLPSFDPAHL